MEKQKSDQEKQQSEAPTPAPQCGEEMEDITGKPGSPVTDLQT
jgi:hypothetical protein